MTATRSLSWWDTLIGTTWSAWGAIRCSQSGSVLLRIPSTVLPRTSVLRSLITASCCTDTAVIAVLDDNLQDRSRESGELLVDAGQLVANGKMRWALDVGCSPTDADISR